MEVLVSPGIEGKGGNVEMGPWTELVTRVTALGMCTDHDRLLSADETLAE